MDRNDKIRNLASTTRWSVFHSRFL